MKYHIFLLVNVILIIEGNLENNLYNYSGYSANSTNKNLTGETLSSNTEDQSVVYITVPGITISNSQLKKSSGNSNNIENSEFYGINAAVLVQGEDAELNIINGTIETAARGANAVCATNSGKVTLSRTIINSTADRSGRGLHSTYGGVITAKDVTVSTAGASCATLATDRGEGIVNCTNCNLTTKGSGSPLIYSTGEITINHTNGESNGAQCVVVEGKNTATIKENSSLKCSGIGNRNNVDNCGVMLYQSQSGDADIGTSTFNCENSELEILSSNSSIYSSVPMFFITNTYATINLENCTFTYGSGIFLNSSGTSEWGTDGLNGGTVILNLTNQNIIGDFVIDSISTLNLNMKNSTIKGKFNNNKNNGTISINLDSSSRISLTGDSYITSLNNSDPNGTNINRGTYDFKDNNGSDFNSTDVFFNTKIILLGFDNYKYNNDSITFNCYFFDTITDVFAEKLYLTTKINYITIRNLQQIETKNTMATCTLGESNIKNQIKYECEIPISGVTINNIEVLDNFIMNSKKVDIDEISPIALDSMKNLQNATNSTFNKKIYLLQESTLENNNKTFNITGDLSEPVEYKNNKIKLKYNFIPTSNKKEELKESDCSIYKLEDNKCLLECHPQGLTNGTISTGYSNLDSGNLFISFQNDSNEIKNVTPTYSGIKNFKRKKRGLNGGHITAIVLSIAAVVGIVGALLFLNKSSTVPVGPSGVIKSDSKININ